MRVFYDQLFVKEPSTPTKTPWHQDLSYWPLTGNDILSFWIPFDSVGQEQGAVAYLKGSHRDGVLYAPRVFAANSRYGHVYQRTKLPPLPPLDEVEPAKLEGRLLSWQAEPGDVIVHHPLTLHYAPGNSTQQRRRAIAIRYIGDDVRHSDRPGTFLDNPAFATILPDKIDALDGAKVTGVNFPVAWPQPNAGLGYTNAGSRQGAPSALSEPHVRPPIIHLKRKAEQQ